MTVRRVSPEEAQELMKQGWVYIDVRSVPEFEAGHPEGAYNVPLVHYSGAGMRPNPEFLDVMERRFPKQTRLVLGCRSGGRSLQAARLLVQAGWTDVVDQRAGFEGAAMPAHGEPGWRHAGLPVAREGEPERSWKALREP